MRRVILTCFSTLMMSTAVFAQAQPIEVPNYGGCRPSDFVTIDKPEISIGFQGSSYDPACVIVKKGTKMTIAASQKHPLQAAADFGTSINPFRASQGQFLTDQTRVLIDVGFFGYYCTRHADPETGDGMGGLIWVVE